MCAVAPVPMSAARAFAPLDLARLISIALIWGVNNVMAKLALNALPPLFTVCLRFLIVLGAVIWLVAPLPAGKVRAMLAMLLLVGPVHFGIQYTGLAMAHELAPMVIAMQLWIPCSVLFAGLVLGERIGALRQAGVGLAFLGVGALSFDPIVFHQLGALALVAGAAACYGLGAVMVRRIGAAIDPWAVQAWIALVTAPVMGLGSAAIEHNQFAAAAAAPWWVWAFVAFGAIVSGIIANAFMFRLVQTYEVSRTTPYLLLTPLISFLMAALVLGDHVSARVALGGALTLAGVALVALAERRFRAGS